MSTDDHTGLFASTGAADSENNDKLKSLFQKAKSHRPSRSAKTGFYMLSFLVAFISMWVYLEPTQEYGEEHDLPSSMMLYTILGGMLTNGVLSFVFNVQESKRVLNNPAAAVSEMKYQPQKTNRCRTVTELAITGVSALPLGVLGGLLPIGSIPTAVSAAVMTLVYAVMNKSAVRETGDLMVSSCCADKSDTAQKKLALIDKFEAAVNTFNREFKPGDSTEFNEFMDQYFSENREGANLLEDKARGADELKGVGQRALYYTGQGIGFFTSMSGFIGFFGSTLNSVANWCDSIFGRCASAVNWLSATLVMSPFMILGLIFSYEIFSAIKTSLMRYSRGENLFGYAIRSHPFIYGVCNLVFSSLSAVSFYTTLELTEQHIYGTDPEEEARFTFLDNADEEWKPFWVVCTVIGTAALFNEYCVPILSRMLCEFVSSCRDGEKQVVEFINQLKFVAEALKITPSQAVVNMFQPYAAEGEQQPNYGT